MNKNLLIVGFFILAMFLNGCIVVLDEETRGPGRPGTHLPDDTIAEIDAVGKLSFDSDREQGYKRIAAREGLSAEAQVHLVAAVYRQLSFENAKEDVLLALINNPSFCAAAERAILEDLDKLSFENSKKRVLQAISEQKNRS